jgi:hypothetical protein
LLFLNEPLATKLHSVILLTILCATGTTHNITGKATGNAMAKARNHNLKKLSAKPIWMKVMIPDIMNPIISDIIAAITRREYFSGIFFIVFSSSILSLYNQGNGQSKVSELTNTSQDVA